MAVIVYRRKTVFGREHLLPEYLPPGTVPTPQVQQAAKALDVAIKKSVERINKEYAEKKEVKENTIEKWRWLGSELATLLTTLDGLEKMDIDNNSIWPAISQYLDSDLTRGFDTKRSGTAKDHLRKAWLLATLPNTDWFNNWIGWDAFVDRGEPLVSDPRILKYLKKIFPDESGELKKDDYQKIARLLVKFLSSRKGNAINFRLLTDQEILKAIEKVKSNLPAGV
jgi:hypothetical protein